MPYYPPPSSGGGGGVTVSSADVAFTDGDTMRRASIVDAGVGATAKIVGSIRRPDIADSADRGYVYSWSIVEIYAGGFDILVSAHGWGFDDPVSIPPNETVIFYYVVG